MSFVLICFLLHFCAASLLVYCNSKKKKPKPGKPEGEEKKTDESKNSPEIPVDKTQPPNLSKEGTEEANKKGSKESEKMSLKDDKKGKEENGPRKSAEKVTTNKKSLEEKKSTEPSKEKSKEDQVKSKIKKTDADSRGSRRLRLSREAKTQCPEKSLSEELASALRSEADAERKRKAEERKIRNLEAKTQYPEKSLIDELNAVLASESAGLKGVQKADLTQTSE
ncbi:hypothetical protein V3C99_002596 [Haemonchus contortus]